MSTSGNPGERTYAEVLAEKYEGKKVEILFDSDWGVRLYSDYNINNKPILVGIIVGADANCLDISLDVKTMRLSNSKILSVNAWSILSVSEYDGVSQILAFQQAILGKQ